jgi:DNA repair ATPase RecN
MSDPTGIQPQQQNITITTTLDNEPKHAEHLGHISVAWSSLEWNMYLLFERISGSPPAIARSIWNAIESTRGRRDMVSGIGTVLIDNDGEKNILDDILRRIGKTASQRNKYIHDTWGVANTQNHEIFQIRDQSDASQKMEQITIPDMQATAANIRKLADELNGFRERISEKVPSWLERYRKLPGLGLQYAPKGHPQGRKPKGYHGRP